MTTRRTVRAVAAACLLVVATVGLGGQAIPVTAQSDGVQASPETVAIGEEVTFSAPDVDTDSYRWDFGDDTRYTENSTMTHEYIEPGTHTVTVAVGSGSEATTYETTVTVEPRFENVTQVEPGAEIRIDGGDEYGNVKVDVYALEVPAEHHFAVSGYGPPDPYELRIYDAEGQQVAEELLSPDPVQIGTVAPEDGETYYVAVEHRDFYRTIRFTELLPPDEFEPNQNRTTAEPVSAGEKRSGVVSAADGVDWFAVESGPGTVEATVDLSGIATNRPNVAVGIYDANGTHIGELGPDTREGNWTSADGASFDYTAVQRAEVRTEGTYYIRVRSVYDEEYTSSPNSTPRIYNLTVDAPPAGPPAIGPAPPTDPDGDGTYEDVNGDGEVDVVDVQALFANLDTAAVRDNPQAFDFNGDGTISVVDVQALFVESNAG